MCHVDRRPSREQPAERVSAGCLLRPQRPQSSGCRGLDYSPVEGSFWPAAVKSAHTKCRRVAKEGGSLRRGEPPTRLIYASGRGIAYRVKYPAPAKTFYQYASPAVLQPVWTNDGLPEVT